MSARTPFVPQRSTSRAADTRPGAPDAKSPPPPGHEPFRPNGLLDPPEPQAANEQPARNASTSESSSGYGFAAKFKPLNVSGFSRKKSDPQLPDAPFSSKARQSLDGSAASARSPKPFSAAVHHVRAAKQRPSSPFFQNPGSLSMNPFKAPAAPAQTSGHGDDFSSNQAHISSSEKEAGYDDHPDLPARSVSGPAQDHFRFSHPLDASFSSHRSRTASHPSLASIHEVAEEEEHVSPRKAPLVGPPADGYGGFTGGYEGDPGFSDSMQDDSFQQALRRSGKRLDRGEDGEDEFEYGVGAKRYKPTAPHQGDFVPPYDHRRTPSRAGERAMTPARTVPLLAPVAQLHPDAMKGMAGQTRGQQALYRLLGQDLDIFVEGHADAYEQARKRWAECSVEEWTKGADDLASRFGNMLDLVKNHMTNKLSLYANLQAGIADHKKTLSEREQTLKDARESLVREGGAVVGGPSVFGAGDGEEKDG